jgi:hypothetical protein
MLTQIITERERRNRSWSHKVTCQFIITQMNSGFRVRLLTFQTFHFLAGAKFGEWALYCNFQSLKYACWNEDRLWKKVNAYRSYRAAPYLRRLVAGFPPRRPGFKPGYGHVVFVVDKVALGQVFSEYFTFPCQSSFHQLLHNHQHHLRCGLVQ